MTHYPYQTDLADGEFGIAPHTDCSFLTCLPPMRFPVCRSARKAANGSMRRPFPGAYVVNGGQLLQRWTDDYFLATPHRAVNRSGGERYALAFFCDSIGRWLPCVGPDKPPNNPTTYYAEYMIRYQQWTYNVFGPDHEDAAE
jgi:isopenicillin N synthase-like dioxygenase